MTTKSENAGYRHARLQDSLVHELRLLLRDDVSDPALENISVLSATLSVDGRHLRVHLVPDLDGGEGPGLDASKRALARVTPYLRHRLAIDLDLKRVPELSLRLHRFV